MPPIHSQTPPVISGYELSPNRGWFGVILPEATINLIANPSVELATTGYGSISGAALSRSTDYQRFGAYSLKITPSASANSGIYYDTVNLTAGQTYTQSVYVLGIGGRWYNLYFASYLTGAQVGPATRFKATGAWQRVKVTYLETDSGPRRLALTAELGPVGAAGSFYVDGWQVENKAYATTYCDGDQTGYTPGLQDYFWTGTPHASTSYRIAASRAGGRIVNLLDYGFGVTTVTGLGDAPPDNVATPYGLLDGAYYQRTVVPPRQFSLVGTAAARDVAQLQRIRAALVAAFRHDSTRPDQPLVLVYQRESCGLDEGQPLYIPCVYSGGLEGNLDNLYQERLAIAFTLFTPYLVAPFDSGVYLDSGDEFTTNSGLYQDLNGTWKAFQASAQTLRRAVVSGQGIFLGFANAAAGTFTVYRFDPATETLTSLGTSSGSATLYALHLDARGRLWAGGVFTSLGGVACINAAYYNFTTATWVAAGNPGFVPRSFTDSTPTTITTVFAGGMNSAGTAGEVKYWQSGTTWTAIAVGAINGPVYAVQCGPLVGSGTFFSQILYIGGNFTSIYGSAISYLAQTEVATLSFSLSAAASGIDSWVSEIAVLPNSNILIGGNFQNIGSQAVGYVAQSTGQFWSPLDTGIGEPLDADCQSLALSPDGLIYAVSPGVDRSFRNVLSACGGVVWNGQVWTPIPWKTQATTPRCVAAYGVGRVIFGGVPTTNQSAGVVSAINRGSTRAYPVCRFTFNGTPGVNEYLLIYLLQNLTTGGRITFVNLIIVPGEIVTFDTNPLNPRLLSNLRGDLTGQIAPGSDLSRFALTPGENRVELMGSTYSASGGADIERPMWWREQFYGLDGATS